MSVSCSVLVCALTHQFLLSILTVFIDTFSYSTRQLYTERAMLPTNYHLFRINAKNYRKKYNNLGRQWQK